MASMQRARDHREATVIDCQREAARTYLWDSARHEVTPAETFPNPAQMARVSVHPRLRGQNGA